MGLKATGCFIDRNQTTNTYFASNPKHQEAKAKLVLEAMGHGDATSDGMCEDNFHVMQPMNGQLNIGAYDDGAFISDNSLIVHLGNGDLNSLTAVLEPVMALYPKSRALLWHVYETVNLYDFAYFENGELLRALVGSIDQDIMFDHGVLLPEEAALVTSREHNGKRILLSSEDGEPFTSAYGCDLTLALTSKFWGVSVYEFLGKEELEVEVFEK